MKSFVFPGQGAQFPGMGKDLYDSSPKAKQLFDQADDVLGFKLSTIMFEGTADELKQTKVTQPAIFLHSVVTALISDAFQPEFHDPDVQTVLVEQQHALEVVERVHVGGVVPVLLRRLRVTEHPGR